MGAEVAVSLAWPATAEGLRVWGAVLLAWVLATYFVAGNTPIIERIGAHPAPGPHPSWKRRAYVRAPALLILLLLILTPRNAGIWALLAALPILASLLPFARAYLAEHDLRWGAEVEIGTNALVVLLSAGLLGDAPDIGRALITIPLAASRLAAVWFALASLGLLTRGGTHVVRGILAKSGAGPLEKGTRHQALAVDVAEYNRGRIIGAVERLIMAAMVAGGAFSALTFLIAAKGLVRSKKFEDPDFAEYFLIGTLSSAALAIACGLLLRAIFDTLW
jgi:hypothetical protein